MSHGFKRGNAKTLGPIHHQNNEEFVEVLNVNSISNYG